MTAAKSKIILHNSLKPIRLRPNDLWSDDAYEAFEKNSAPKKTVEDSYDTTSDQQSSNLGIFD